MINLPVTGFTSILAHSSSVSAKRKLKCTTPSSKPSCSTSTRTVSAFDLQDALNPIETARRSNLLRKASGPYPATRQIFPGRLVRDPFQKWRMPATQPARAHVTNVSDQKGTQKSRTILWRLRSVISKYRSCAIAARMKISNAERVKP